jgi:hypothetical protein
MATKSLRLIGLLVATTLFMFSCTSPIKLHQSFIANKSSMAYMHDSDIDPDSTPFVVTVAKPEITFWQMKGTGMVRQTKSSVVPLIFINTWNTEYEYLLGNGGIKENVASFIRKSIITESERSGSFTPVEEDSTNNFVLEIEVDSIGAKGAYKMQGYFFFVLMAYGYGQTESADPGTAFSRFHYKLRKGDEVLLEDFTSSKQVSKPLAVRHESRENLRRFYNSNLVEALSQTIKTNIEIIIEDIDLFLYEQKMKAKANEAPSVGSVSTN